MGYPLWAVLLLLVNIVKTNGFKLSDNEVNAQSLRNLNARTPILGNPGDVLQTIIDQKQNVKTTTLEYFQSLLQTLTNKKQAATTPNRRTELTNDEINILRNYLRNVLEQRRQLQQESPQVQSNDRPSNTPTFDAEASLIDLLYPQDSAPTNPAANPIAELLLQIQVPNEPNRNNNADVPYIPAVHGSNFVENVDGPLLSALGLNSANATTNNIQTLPTRLSSLVPTRLSSTTLTNCLGQSGCILALAFILAVGGTSALAIPLFFGKRKKRSADDINSTQEDIMRLIERYHKEATSQSEGQPAMSSVFNPLSGIQFSNENSDSWKTHQDSANLVPDTKPDAIKPEINKDKVNENIDQNYEHPFNGEVPLTPSARNSETKEPENSHNVKILDTDFLENLKGKTQNKNSLDEAKNTISKTLDQVLPMEHRTDSNQNVDQVLPMKRRTDSDQNVPANEHPGLQISTGELNEFSEGKSDNLIGKLRSDIASYLTELQKEEENINISKNYEKQSEGSYNSGDVLKSHRDSIISTLNVMLNKNSESNIQRGTKPKPGFTSTLLNPNVQNPLENLSTGELIKNLIAQYENEKRPTIQQPTTQINNDLPALQNGNDINDMLKLLSQINKQQNDQQANSNKKLNSLLQLALMNQFINKPQPTQTQQVPFPIPTQQRPSNQPIPQLITNNPAQANVPVKTVNNILRNPNLNTQSLQSVLSKLPQLITGPQRKRIPNSPSFSATVVNQSPAGVAAPIPVLPKPQIVLTSPQSSMLQMPNNMQNLSPEAKKFYTLLCRAILQPKIPLNRVTAYIAEKCLVMRFTGILQS